MRSMLSTKNSRILIISISEKFGVVRESDFFLCFLLNKMFPYIKQGCTGPVKFTNYDENKTPFLTLVFL